MYDAVTIRKEVGIRLKAVRETANFTREEAETSLSVPARSLEPYEQGRRLPADDVLEALGELYGVHPAVLRYGSEVLSLAAESEVARQLRIAASTIHGLADAIADRSVSPAERAKRIEHFMYPLVAATESDADAAIQSFTQAAAAAEEAVLAMGREALSTGNRLFSEPAKKRMLEAVTAALLSARSLPIQDLSLTELGQAIAVPDRRMRAENDDLDHSDGVVHMELHNVMLQIRRILQQQATQPETGRSDAVGSSKAVADRGAKKAARKSLKRPPRRQA